MTHAQSALVPNRISVYSVDDEGENVLIIIRANRHISSNICFFGAKLPGGKITGGKITSGKIIAHLLNMFHLLNETPISNVIRLASKNELS